MSTALMAKLQSSNAVTQMHGAMDIKLPEWNALGIRQVIDHLKRYVKLRYTRNADLYHIPKCNVFKTYRHTM